MPTSVLRRDRRFRLLPTTHAGRVAGWLALGFVAWFAFNELLVGLSSTISWSGAVRVAVIALSWAGLALGLAASLVASWAIVRRRERSLVAFVTTLPGLLVLALLVGELVAPH